MLDPALGMQMRIPDAGLMPVDVRTVPPFRLTLIPLLSVTYPDMTLVGDVEAMAADPLSHELLEGVRTLLPVVEIDVTMHEPVVTSAPPRRQLSQIDALRLMEGGSGYWMGIFEIPSTEIGGAFAGVAILGGSTSISKRNATTIAHELGHNLGLMHAPCRAPGSRSLVSSSNWTHRGMGLRLRTAHAGAARHTRCHVLLWTARLDQRLLLQQGAQPSSSQ